MIPIVVAGDIDEDAEEVKLRCRTQFYRETDLEGAGELVVTTRCVARITMTGT